LNLCGQRRIHLDLNPSAHIFSWIFLGFTGVVRKMVSGVPIDNEASMVTSGIFRSVGCSNPLEVLVGGNRARRVDADTTAP
jgi:hypothetical protein